MLLCLPQYRFKGSEVGYMEGVLSGVLPTGSVGAVPADQMLSVTRYPTCTDFEPLHWLLPWTASLHPVTLVTNSDVPPSTGTISKRGAPLTMRPHMDRHVTMPLRFSGTRRRQVAPTHSQRLPQRYGTGTTKVQRAGLRPYTSDTG